MTRHHSADFSHDDLLLRLCLVCDIQPALLSDPEHFPRPDYRVDGVPYWRAETVRGWVQAYAWTEILRRPRELAQRVERLQLALKLAGAEPLAPAAARVQALHQFVDAWQARIFGS